MLRTRFYVGVVTFRDEEFRGQHEALIDEELYAAAQLMRGRARPRRMVTGPSGVLQGRVFCAKCGSRLHAERKMANRPRYRERHGTDCDSNGRSVVADIIDAQLGVIWSSLELPQDWRTGIAHLVAEDSDAASRVALEAKRKRLGMAFVDGMVSEADYHRARTEIDAALATMNPAPAPLYEEAATLLADLPKVWELATAEERRRLLAPMLSAVYVDLTDRLVRGVTPTPGFDALLRGAVRCRPGAAVTLVGQRKGTPEGVPIGGLVETGEETPEYPHPKCGRYSIRWMASRQDQ